MVTLPLRPGIVALWSAPRSRSTAFYRSMLERDDLIALHEPFCNLVDHGETDVGDRVVRSPAELIAEMWRLSRTTTVFLKDTTDYRYPEVLADEELLTRARHTFLIRRPDEIAASFYALKPDMARSDIGLEHMWELVERVRGLGGAEPVIIESDDLLAQPEATISAYCREVGLPFVAEALAWESGPRSEWQRSQRWHQDVVGSTGIEPRESHYSDTPHNNATLAAYAEHHRPFYDQLFALRLRIA